jgi:acetoin utilization deacetylase AcuC-like enzyme
MNQLTIFTDKTFVNHKTGYGHPENHNRINVLLDLLQEYEGNENLKIQNLEQSTAIEPTLVHSSDYLNYLKKNIPPQNGFLLLDEDTIASNQSLETALSALKIHSQALDFTLKNKQPSLVLSRPPGHHARTDTSMGFCIFNNIAYTAELAKQKGIKKILILDWDVHHFNGTEEMFYEDSEVYTISMHQYPHWPTGYGWCDRRGKGLGQGYNLNIPLPKESGDWQAITCFEQFILPQIQKFQPELILVSAGFDAHKLERNSSLGVKSLLTWTQNTYSYLTYRLIQLAKEYSQNRIIFTLEGGYNLISLEQGVKSVIDTVLTNQILSYPEVTTGIEMDKTIMQEYMTEIQNNL